MKKYAIEDLKKLKESIKEYKEKQKEILKEITKLEKLVRIKMEKCNEEDIR